MRAPSNIILRAENVGCTRTSGPGGPPFPGHVSLACETGGMTLLWGGEESGKNAVLRVLGLLEAPAEGEVYFDGSPTGSLSEEARATLRNRHFGFIFTEPFLLPSFTVVENIAMPLLKISAVSTEEARSRTLAMLDFTGLREAGECGIEQLSLFEQHKAALARALANQPEVLVVENVDATLHGDELAQFVALIRRACEEFRTAAILTAECGSVAPQADRTLQLVDGSIAEAPQSAAREEEGSVQ